MSVRMDTLGSVYKYRDSADLQHFVGEFYADETSDISGKTQLAGVIAEPNSTAYVVQAGKLYVLGGDNKWYDTDGNEVE